MTVKISKPALNLREKLSELENTVEYSQHQFWFDGFVTNGTFDTDTTGWAANNATLSVVSNKLRISNSGTSYGYAWQGFTTKIGKKYTFNLDYTLGTSNSAGMRVGTTVGGSQIGAITMSSSGSYSITFTATTTTTYILVINLQNVDTRYSDVDNISVFEIDANDDVIYTLPLGWKPLHVYEDGILQREGSAEDYTVIKQDGYNIIKPTVAPSASTETCVIAERKL
jgi:hypothetical protein